MDKDQKILAGEIILTLRTEYGLSQREMAKRVTALGTPLCERHYRRIEKGEMVPSVLLAMSICSVLDADVYQVWG